MKKVFLCAVLVAGFTTFATAQKTTKTTKATTTTTNKAKSEEVAGPVTSIKEVPVYDDHGNRIGTKHVQVDAQGNSVTAPEVMEKRKARALEAESTTPNN